MKSNEEVQRTNNKGRSQGVRNGARGRVDEAIGYVGSCKLPVNTVLVVGPQHGFELERYKERGVEALGVEIVKDFVEDCKELGLNCVYSPIEKFKPREFDGVHVSHTLEHCYDIKKAIKVIKKCAKHWVYVSIPIHPEGVKKGRSDFTSIRNKKKLPQLFRPWKVLKTITKTKNTHTVLFVPN